MIHVVVQEIWCWDGALFRDFEVRVDVPLSWPTDIHCRIEDEVDEAVRG